MSLNKPRPSVLDLVILVAATAAGLSLTRTLPTFMEVIESTLVNYSVIVNPTGGSGSAGWSDSTVGSTFTTSGRPLTGRTSYWLSRIPCWASPCLVSLSLTSTLLSLRAPRPRRRRLARRPSLIAGVALILALVALGVQRLQVFSADGIPSFANLLEYFEGPRLLFLLIPLPRLAGYSVALGWLVLALSGRWSPEVNAGGRLGQALGWCWIALAISSELGTWCFGLNY